MALVLAAVVLLPDRARAQDCTEDAPEPVDASVLALGSIDSESHAATALYVTALSTFLTGAGLGAGAAGTGISRIGVTYRAEGGGVDWTPALSVTSMVLLGLSVIALPIAIGLDVDAGSRRGAWQRERGDQGGGAQLTALRIAPSGAGLSLAIDGRF